MGSILGSTASTRRRFGAYTRGADGRATAGAAVDSALVVGIQPIRGVEREQLPEGIRSRADLKFYTKTELRAADVDAATPADQVVVTGGPEAGTYEILAVARQRMILPHYRAFAARLSEKE